MKNIFWIQGRIFLQKEIQCRQAYGQIQSIRDCHAMIMIHDEFNQNYDNSGMFDIFRATMPIRETRDGNDNSVSPLFSPGSENCSLSRIICLPLPRKSASHPALAEAKLKVQKVYGAIKSFGQTTATVKNTRMDFLVCTFFLYFFYHSIVLLAFHRYHHCS